MIYRLTTGARSEVSKYITSGLLVLAITIGFPMAAAWLNQENLTLRPRPIAQEGKTTAVLGDSTDKASSTPSGNDSNTMHVSATPAPQPLKVAPQRHASTTTSTTTAVAPVASTPVTTPESTTPVASASVTTPSEPTTSDPTVGLDVGVVDSNVSVGVSPDGVDAGIQLGL